MIWKYLVFLIQILIVVLVFAYVYYIFRHSVTIPRAEDYIKQLSPGLSDLTKTNNEIFFWFYSLKRQKYIKYSISNGDDLQVKKYPYSIEPPTTHLNNLANGYYFNFSHQRWEKMVFDENTTPAIDIQRNSIEQTYQLCFLDNNDETTTKSNQDTSLIAVTNANYLDNIKVVCNENRQQTYIRMKVENQNFIFDNTNRLFKLNKNTAFPSSGLLCKFSINRYKEYLNIDYEYGGGGGDGNSSSANIDSAEINDIGIYFERKTESTDNWQLRECQPDSHTMFFDGTTCKPKDNNRLSPTVTLSSSSGNEIFKSKITYADLPHTQQSDIHALNIQLNASYSMWLNLNVPEKIYPLDIDHFYRCCQSSLFVVGETTTSAGVYSWRLEQFINDKVIKILKTENLSWIPLLDRPRELFILDTASTVFVDRPFIIYRRQTFSLRAHFIDVYEAIYKSKPVQNLTISEGSSASSSVANQTLLPHVRMYWMWSGTAAQWCRVYAMFAGNSIMDIYIETRLLSDYVADISRYPFYGRGNMYPSVEDDFQTVTWSCAVDVDNPERFTYISLVDLFGLETYVTVNKMI